MQVAADRVFELLYRRHRVELYRWLLRETVPAEVSNWSRADLLEWIAPGTYFLSTKDIDFDTMIRNKDWYMYCSTWSRNG